MWRAEDFVGGGIFLAILIGCVVLWWKARAAHRSWLSDRNASGRPFRIIAAVVAIFILIYTAGFFYPYEVQYHRWDEKSGTVAEVNRRMVPSGDGTEEKFVVRFAEDRQEYGCEDTRCAAVEQGDRLTLSCLRVWQYSGTDGWDCAFVRNQES